MIDIFVLWYDVRMCGEESENVASCVTTSNPPSESTTICSRIEKEVRIEDNLLL
jgi:hypothetical protein